MRKVIIVEGKQDAVFVKALAPNVETRQIEIQQLSGAGKDAVKALEIALKRVKNDALFNPIEKIGILLDLDPADFTIKQKLAFVNQATEATFGITLANVNTLHNISTPDFETQIACHFISPNLDVLIKSIAALPSPKADCLFACLEKDSTISSNEKQKAWPLYYMRWDVCNEKDRENGLKNVTFTHTHTKGAWNLDSPVLNDLKVFLALF